MRGRDTHDGLEIRRCCGATFAGKLEYQVAAHRVANQGEAANEVCVGQLGHHHSYVLGAPRVIDGGRECFAVTAAAHIHASNVATGRQSARRDPQNVPRRRGTLESVNDDHC
jgi:tagatose-1,6-bisphosphate aldolase non-catalytic subunit AgaZ/GatZ